MPFNGERLKMARIYRNMNITELAESIGVKKQSISQFENGVIKPKPDTEFALINKLGFPREFFYRKSSDTEIENTFFRALSSTPVLDKKTQEIKTQIIIQIYNFLCEYLELPYLELPVNRLGKFNDIEEIALRLRQYWNLGEKPIPNMVNLIENKGIIVSAFDVDSDKIDAFTQVQTSVYGKQYCVVVGNNKKSAVRRNFDIAHELGHIILHNNIGSIEELSKEEFRNMETEANQFAAAFLLPKNAFYEDLKQPNKLMSYIPLKEKWHVSISAMLIRAKSLDRITMTEYQSLVKSMAYRKWRTKEPLDDKLKMPVPTLFCSALEVLFENNILNAQTFMNELSAYGLPMKASELENLLALPPNMLNVVIENSIIDIKPIISIKNNEI